MGLLDRLLDRREEQGRAAEKRYWALIVVLVVAPLSAQNKLYTFLGDSAGDNFGNSVAGAGDVNMDGYDDLIVGACYDGDNGTNSGSVRVLSGIDGSNLYTFLGNSNNDVFGYSVAGAGDVNQDGYDDLIVGAPRDNDNGAHSGSVWVLSGFDGTNLYTFYGDSAHDHFGQSAAGSGDVNMDGYGDLIVGAPYDDDNGNNNSGSVRVLSGIDGSILYTFFGAALEDRFGFSVAGSGDVNNDGYDDIVVGAKGNDDNGVNAGSAQVLSGLDGTNLYTFYGDSANDRFGKSVSGAGDVNKDGYADLIVGAWLDDNGTNPGSARVLSGIDGSILYTFYGNGGGGRFGWSVASAGDINQDGFPDFIAGAPYDNDSGFRSGGARVFSGLGVSSIGQSCTVAPCDFCPSMVATTSGGAPTLGNNVFALELLNAPSNMEYAILGISGSPCALPGETFGLPFCDTIKASEPLEFLAVVPFTAGVGACATNITVPAPVPSDPMFLGFPLGVQWAISCNAGSHVGKSVSNCVSFVVTGT